MSFPRYPKYKDSGAEWIGDVPAHWDVTRVRWLFEIQKRIVGELGFDVLSITQQGFRIKDVESNEGQVSLDYSKYQLVEVGDFAMNHMDLITGGVDIARSRGVTSPDYRVFSIRDQVTVCDRYFLYVFQNCLRERIFFAYGQGSSQLGRWRFPTDNFKDFRFPVPLPVEQEAIARFLDRETAKIDGLVGEQRRLIDLLNEKHQAVISHAVTKGLNPHAGMKPSGIEWLGDVPEHWRVVALKRIAGIQTGIAKGKDNGVRKTISVPYLRVANVQDGYVDLENVTTIEIPVEDLHRYTLKKGDVLMNEGGDFDKLGRGCVWEGQIDPCITQNHVFAVRPSRVSSAWLNAIAGSDYAQFYFMTRSKQSTNLASISSTNLMELHVILPPDGEQQILLSFIADQTSLLGELTAEAQRAIDVLQERRTALLSAAVTGKIDVRGTADAEAA